MARQRSRLRIGPRDREIMQFIGEQGISWLEPLHRKFYADRSVDAVKSTLRRLCGKEPHWRYLRSDYLDAKRKYVRLTPRGARLMGFGKNVCHALGRTALIRRYSFQWFIEVNGHDKRWSCRPDDHPELFAVCGDRKPRGNFFIETCEQGTVLGIAIGDFGSDARRVSRRAVDAIEKYVQRGWFDELICAGRFMVVFLTVTSCKADSLARQFERDSKNRLTTPLRRLGAEQPILADFVVVPGLVDMLPPSPSKTRR